MIPRRVWWVSIAAVIAASACGRNAAVAPFHPPWKRYITTFDMAGAYDTSRIRVGDDEIQVWLRFRYSHPMSAGRPPVSYSIVEVRESLRCKAGEARNELLVARDSMDDSIDGYTVPTPRWQTFDSAGLGASTLAPLCQKLGAE